MNPNLVKVEPWKSDFEVRLRNARSAALELPNEEFDGGSLSTLVQAVVDEYAASEVTPRFDSMRAATREMPVMAGGVVPETAPPLVLELRLPCEGAALDLLAKVASSTHSQGSAFELVVSFEIAGDVDAGSLADLRAQWTTAVSDAVRTLNATIREHRVAVEKAVTTILATRYSRRRALAEAAEQADLTLDQEPDAQATMTLQPRQLTLADVEASAAAGGNESGLAEDIAMALIEQVRSFARALERSPTSANALAGEDEETIRDVLLFVLNSQWRGLVTGETFLGHGKTDILLRWRDRDAFIGECKFWKGDQYFEDGVEQLLERYTVWRATRVALLVFIRDRMDVGAVMDKARDRIKAHPRFVGQTHGEEDTFILRAQADQRKLVTATLIFVVIPKR